MKKDLELNSIITKTSYKSNVRNRTWVHKSESVKEMDNKRVDIIIWRVTRILTKRTKVMVVQLNIL
jgi:hypothetical protein